MKYFPWFLAIVMCVLMTIMTGIGWFIGVIYLAIVNENAWWILLWLLLIPILILEVWLCEYLSAKELENG